ncbi:MAG: WbqC family protein [Cyclobacteriaceae bacterium]|nr:WbqC family protein [Cyclobacteriaceae bacterium]
MATFVNLNLHFLKALITQSNYIPWKGYFDSIAAVDVFVVYDEMQYTKRDWRNRNQRDL